MDVIESLKSKTEEENGNSVEVSGDETDGSGESADHSSASSDTNRENPDNTGADDSVQSLPKKRKPKRSRKQEEVVGECSTENKDRLENKIPSEKADAESCSPKQGVGAKTRSRKAENAVVENVGECSIENKESLENKIPSETLDAKSCSPKQGVEIGRASCRERV